MTRDEALEQLKNLGDEKRRKHNKKNGAGDNQFGVPMGEIRKLAKKIKTNHELGLELWETGIIEAQLLAILILKPKELSAEQVDKMVRQGSFGQVADWFGSYVLKDHPDKELLRLKWLNDDDPWAARHGWGLTSERISKNPEGLDLQSILVRIEREMGEADAAVQWTMNSCLAAIGINFPDKRERAITIGETLGVYRDYPVPKGCTSPFAPIWIEEMVKRKG